MPLSPESNALLLTLDEQAQNGGGPSCLLCRHLILGRAYRSTIDEDLYELRCDTHTLRANMRWVDEGFLGTASRRAKKCSALDMLP